MDQNMKVILENFAIELSMKGESNNLIFYL